MRFRFRRPTAIVVLALFLVDCAQQVQIAPSDRGASETIEAITKTDGTVVHFSDDVQGIVHDTLIANANGTTYRVPMDSVQRMWVSRRSTGAKIALTLGIVVGVTAMIAGIALLAKQSCPFIYSWNGSQYVFDGEPYGGAITRGLERDDYSRLELLRPDSGAYKLLMTNEVNETQYTNLADLWVVSHPAGVRVTPDMSGDLHTLAAVQRPLSARDGDGNDLMPWLGATDLSILEPEPIHGGSTRSEIVLTFTKPAGATSLKLVTNLGTGLLGSEMFRDMLTLQGTKLDAWYAQVDSNSATRDSLLYWDLREELYLLKLEVDEPGGWVERGIVTGGGPFVHEDRVVVLDVSHVAGDVVRIRMRPPRGFWAFNSFAADYSPDVAVVVDTVALASAIDSRGTDVRAALLQVDDQYYAMPNTGDQAKLTYPVPAMRAGLERTVFLHSRGYYRLHLTPSGPPDVAALDQLANEPEAAARFAAGVYFDRQLAVQHAP